MISNRALSNEPLGLKLGNAVCEFVKKRYEKFFLYMPVCFISFLAECKAIVRIFFYKIFSATSIKPIIIGSGR